MDVKYLLVGKKLGFWKTFIIKNCNEFKQVTKDLLTLHYFSDDNCGKLNRNRSFCKGGFQLANCALTSDSKHSVYIFEGFLFLRH